MASDYYSTVEDLMVSGKVLKELRELYESDERAIDLHKYSDRLFDVVFEIITADTFVAGVVSKVLEKHSISLKERRFIGRPLTLNGSALLKAITCKEIRAEPAPGA